MYACMCLCNTIFNYDPFQFEYVNVLKHTLIFANATTCLLCLFENLVLLVLFWVLFNSFSFDLIFFFHVIYSICQLYCLWPVNTLDALINGYILYTRFYSFRFGLCFLASFDTLSLSPSLAFSHSCYLGVSLWTCLRRKKTCYCFSIALNVHVYRMKGQKKKKRKNAIHTLFSYGNNRKQCKESWRFHSKPARDIHAF